MLPLRSAGARVAVRPARVAPLDELQQALSERLAAEIAFARTRQQRAARLLDAARRLEPLDGALAREYVVRGDGGGDRRIGQPEFGRLRSSSGCAGGTRPAAHDRPAPRRPWRRGSRRATSAGLPPLRQALDGFRDVDGLTPGDVRWLSLACPPGPGSLGRRALAHAARHAGVRIARDTSTLNLLPNMADCLAAGWTCILGRFANAVELIDEVEAITPATGFSAAGILRRSCSPRRAAMTRRPCSNGARVT